MATEGSGEIRKAAVRALESRGYTVENVARGAGSPPWSMIKATKDEQVMHCSVKVATRPQGRIHYELLPDGGWNSLSKATHVVHAWRHPDTPDRVRVSFFDAQTIKTAFDKNVKSKRISDLGDLPSWISPEFEKGRRFVGSGYGSEALWTQVVPLDDAATTASASYAAPLPEGEGIMDRIKAMLAAHMGVAIERIEVDVRVKL